MLNVFEDVRLLDRRCYEEYGLNEDLLMEHAASALAREIREQIMPQGTVLTVCGPGNNGADGIALARMLHSDYEVQLYLAMEQRTDIGKRQLDRCHKIGVRPVSCLSDADAVVDCLFGSGLERPLDSKMVQIIKKLNSQKGYKLACDIPSGIYKNGHIDSHAFQARKTITMGALKQCLFSDAAKDFTGEIEISDLGISHLQYETKSDMHLLEKTDLRLPIRDRLNVHKGDFGHLTVLCGDKPGAAMITGRAALAFGAGLVTLVGEAPQALPYELMWHETLPETTTAVAMGMGLGETLTEERILDMAKNRPVLIDADLFYKPGLKSLLAQNPQAVLTPHPKEFSFLLEMTGICRSDVSTIQKDRFSHVRRFCEACPECVLVLKGANTLIAQGKKIFINPFGTPALSKGGSGDVLSGLIGALLAQGIAPLESAIQGSLAQTLAAQNYSGHNFALTPSSLIETLSTL